MPWTWTAAVDAYRALRAIEHCTLQVIHRNSAPLILVPWFQPDVLVSTIDYHTPLRDEDELPVAVEHCSVPRPTPTKHLTDS
jgi:hypothetical protein